MACAYIIAYTQCLTMCGLTLQAPTTKASLPQQSLLSLLRALHMLNSFASIKHCPRARISLLPLLAHPSCTLALNTCVKVSQLASC